jgi:hypothetical protein
VHVNCTDRVTPIGWQIYLPTFVDRGVSLGHYDGYPLPLILVF